ncbi:MAG: ABC transporter permease [Faecalibacterium sp.]|nr:ABC transporter permease [Ruminococcus sp.]MCM1392374.1 ABC transporter permease [Ruminococcus sp.]MCM1486688.1 ABC transporter permease [Faecalibacterium sp.]
MKTKMSPLAKFYVALIMIFLYAPIVVMIVFSFNDSVSTSVMAGFSLRWYRSLMNDSATISALKNTLILAVTSSICATVMGTAAAVGINSMRNKWVKRATMSVTNIPMMNPEIVTGISMMLLFVFVGKLIGVTDVLGFWTMLIAHITFNLPYVILSVLPKLRQLDPHLPEAAMDLGCTPIKAFFKVTIPSISTGIISGLMMSFTLSLDDFVISYFTQGPTFETLPIRIFSMTKKRVTPDMYALSTLIFVSILLLLILFNVSQIKGEKRMRNKLDKGVK